MFEKEVAAGSAWLDAQYPGWWKRINIWSLDMNTYSHCVLGQTLGGSIMACKDHLSSNGMPWAWRHGFGVGSPSLDGPLEACWVAEIKKRRRADEVLSGALKHKRMAVIASVLSLILLVCH